MSGYIDDDLGFLYVAVNPALPGMVKIGKSTRVPNLRAKELSTTGLPDRFECVYFALMNNHSEAEQYVHKKLAEFRVSESREFFRVPILEARGMIKRRCPLYSHDWFVDYRISEIREEEFSRIYGYAIERDMVDLLEGSGLSMYISRFAHKVVNSTVYILLGARKNFPLDIDFLELVGLLKHNLSLEVDKYMERVMLPKHKTMLKIVPESVIDSETVESITLPMHVFDYAIEEFHSFGTDLIYDNELLLKRGNE